MLVVTLLSAATVLVCVLIHYETFRLSARFLGGSGITPRRNLALLTLAALAAHIAEIWIYAVVLYIAQGQFGLGHIAGDFSGALFDYVYFSAVSYTSLGLGDVWPHGPIRLLIGVEGLNGLILIGWTIAFTYPIVRDACHREHR